MLKTILITFALFFAYANAGLAKDETRIVERILQAGVVQHHVRPRPIEDESAPVNIRINLYVRHIEKVDVVNGVWKLQLTFRQEWNDSRLAFYKSSVDLKHVTLTAPDIIWTPNIFISQELEGKTHSVYQPLILIRIDPEGQVLHSSRITVLLTCPELATGKDTVVCPLKIGSYAYTNQDVQLSWADNPIVLNSGDLFLEKNCPYGLTPGGVNTTLDESPTPTGSYAYALGRFTFTKGSKCLA